MPKHFSALLVTLAFTLSAHGQLVPEDAVPEKVADGYEFTEGPALGPDGCIYFTDIPAELILKFDPESGETKTVVEKSGQANGLFFDRHGGLYACHHRFRQVTRVDIHPDGTIFGSVVPETFEGKKFNSPNDLAIDTAGNIYFTDPRYGNRDSMEMQIEGVYFATAKAANQETLEPVKRIDAELVRPNGIILSPDESILYVADHAAKWIYAYDIKAPGEVENKRKFAQLNDGQGRGSDGMTVDSKGRLYTTGHGKVWVFEPTGQLVATIDVGPQTTNCTFGDDGKTLYITANKGLYRITLNTETLLKQEAPTLKIGLGKLEISAILPVQFSAATSSAYFNKDGKQWRLQKGQVTVNQPMRGGRISTITEIANRESNLLIRLKLEASELAEWAKKLDEKNGSSHFLMASICSGPVVG